MVALLILKVDAKGSCEFLVSLSISALFARWGAERALIHPIMSHFEHQGDNEADKLT